MEGVSTFQYIGTYESMETVPLLKDHHIGEDLMSIKFDKQKQTWEWDQILILIHRVQYMEAVLTFFFCCS
jgi:hypothetical protein